MPFLITRGLGSQGDGTSSGLASVQGIGDPGATSVVGLLLVEVYSDRLELVFTTNVQLVGPAALPAQWVITTGVSGAPIPVVTSVAVVGPRVKLYYTEGRTGVLYLLNLPVVGIQSTFAVPFSGPFTSAFTGVGIVPYLVVAGANDGYHVKVIFSEPVVAAEALIPANYVITGGAGLVVYEVIQENSQVFELRTSLQVVGQSYLVTVNNVHDLQGNIV